MDLGEAGSQTSFAEPAQPFNQKRRCGQGIWAIN
jgi:hypothetical protein